jgi:hypothetical protein
MNSRAQNSKQDLALKGTETVPGIAFLSDVNTGIFSPAADNFAISTGGMVAMLVTSSQILNLSNALPVSSGGTGTGSYTIGDILYASAPGTLSKLPAGANGYVLTINSGVPAWTAAAASGVSSISFGSTGLTPSTASTGAVSVSGTLATANGGTGSSSYSNGQLLIGNGSSGLTKSTLTAGSGITITNGSGSITISASGTAGVSSLSMGSTGLTPSTSSTGAVTVAGTLAIANGGTGATTAANARTGLGLGTIATQAANNVAITGGSITGLSSLRVSGQSYEAIGNGTLNVSATTSLFTSGTGLAHSASGVPNFATSTSAFTLQSGITPQAFGTTVWTNVSDARIKKDVSPYGLGTAALNQLRPVNYIYNGEYGTPDGGPIQAGLIAQEVLTTPLSSMVGTRVYTDPNTGVETTLYDVNTNQLVFALINAVKELDARIKTLEAKVG